MTTVSFIPGPQTDRNRWFVEIAARVLGRRLATVEDAVPLPGSVLVLGERASLPHHPGSAPPAFIQLLGCSSDSVDSLKFAAAGVKVAGVSEAVSGSVASFAVAGIIAGLRMAASGSLASKVDVLRLLAQRPAADPLSGKKAGVIGLGRVGQQAARKLKQSGADIVYCDIRTAPFAIINDLGVRRVTLDRLLTTCDAVTVHVPHGPTADPVIGIRDLGLMAPGAVLVNTSHHTVVDTGATAAALGERRLGAYVLDCPGAAGDTRVAALGKFMSAVVTPGIASAEPGDDRAAAELALSNVEAVLAGRHPRSLIEVLDFPKAGDPAFWSSAMSPRSTAAGGASPAG
jgi:glyoxylate reductase